MTSFFTMVKYKYRYSLINLHKLPYIPNFTSEPNIMILIRSVENNDWVILVLLGVASIYATMFRLLNKDQSLLEYMKLPVEYGGNLLMNWVVSGFIYVSVSSVLLFDYVQEIPDFVTDNISLWGYNFNEFWFIFIVNSVFYIIKCIFSYLFFVVTGNVKRWKTYVFVVNKLFYFAILPTCLLVFIYYFYPINQDYFFNILVIFFFLLLLLKNIFLIVSANKPLPREWYYKFLYICTLQILPHLILWWFLFFQYYR